MEWIDVNDRLPELVFSNDWGYHSVPVLCRQEDGHHEDCQLNQSIDDNSKSYWTYVQDGEYTECVTHWMPLPKLTTSS